MGGQTHDWFKVTRCAGGEVKVVANAQIRRNDAHGSDVLWDVRLYEGVSCSTSDLDLWKDTPWWRDVPNTEKLHVDNLKEGGDYADMTLKVRSVPVYPI